MIDTTLGDSLQYHANKHWGGDVGGYLRAASNFSTKGATSTGLRADRSIRNTKNGQFAIFRNGKLVTFGKQ